MPVSLRAYHCEHADLPLPPHHPFPFEKYRETRRRVMAAGWVGSDALRPAPAATREQLLRVHDAAFVDAFLAGELDADHQKRIGFPWCEELVTRCLASAGGTVAAAWDALESGGAGHLAGGTHHAHRDRAAGYCVFHDLAVAAEDLLAAARVQRALIVDLDVHHGDGTATIFADDPRVFTLSVHGAGNFPRDKPPSDLDVALDDGTEDEVYLDAVARALTESFDRARPDFVFYQAGVDPLRGDRFGRLAVSHAGLLERDRMVFRACRRAGVPVTWTMGGGYAKPVERTIEAHVGTWRAAAQELLGALVE